MEYKKITREIFNNTMYVRILDDGDVEILEDTDEFYEDDWKNKDTIENEDGTIIYFWNEWVSKDMWKNIWLKNNGDGDTEITDISLIEIKDKI